MAIKLTAAEKKQHDALAAELMLAEEAVGTAVDILNSKLEEVREFIAEIVERCNEEIGEKSEKWQEGEKGSAASEWVSTWESFEAEEVEQRDMIHEAFAELTGSPDE